VSKTSSSLKLAVLSLLSAATVARADVLTFDNTAGVELPGADFVASLYTYFEHPSTYGDYTFTTPVNTAQWYAGYWNAVVFCGGSSVNCAYNGTDHLIATPTLNVKRSDGNTFSLNGFDLDNTHDTDAASAQASFTVTGTKADGSIISTSVTLDALPNSATFGTSAAFNHFRFSGFTNLTSFEIARTTPNDWNFLTLDNLDVNASAAPVPEPSAWAMLGLGLAGLAAYAKRRKA
jgi:hypothetical protein